MAEEKKRSRKSTKAKSKEEKTPTPVSGTASHEQAGTGSEPRRLYRSISDRYIAGVCGGVAEYFHIDPTLVRILWALSLFVGGIGFVAYIAAWIIVPENPYDLAASPERETSSDNLGMIIGIVLIVIGIALLVDELNLRFLFPWRFHFFDGGFLLSILIIGLGLYLIFNKDTAKTQSTETQGAVMHETKRLTRTVHDRKIAGVCGGLARYLNVDPSIVRVLYVLLTISSLFLGIIAYIVMAIVLPEEDEQMHTESHTNS